MHPSSACYTLGNPPVTGTGFSVSSAELDKALLGPVASIAFDDAGAEEISSLLEGMADTEFSRENLDFLLSDHHPLEDWRVGEAFAENFLKECRDCYFPWPDGRDERKRGSSLPGADLVGFRKEGEEVRFAFGEVKTSHESTYPPRAIFGRHGLKQQMEDLRDNQEIRNGLVRYLAYRANNTTWKDRYLSAAKHFLNDPCDVRIFGLLVRDVPPHEDDLRVRVDTLGHDCPSRMVIELIAIYLPAESIASLATKVVKSRPIEGSV